MGYVKLNSIDKIKKRLGLEINGPVQAFFTETCYNHMDKYVPMDKGNLRTIVDLEDSSITYESPYARYQYYGEREDGSHKVRNYTTPGTGPYWDRRMVSAEIGQVVKEVQDYVNQGGK
ncbi:minor capsid protein [uncultured Rikenella sp.]|uniref:minor capsid protein n=1 Tax=uncultured Rikenella sp. TaxID=368003 RepID=UPI0026100E70|nr:minor capsid protein [uncultured Rikenella sp.]